MMQGSQIAPEAVPGTLRLLVEGSCRSPRDVLRTIGAECSPLIGNPATDHGLFDRESLMAYCADRFGDLEGAPRPFVEAALVIGTPQHEGSVVRCREDMAHPFVFQGETGKASVLEMLGVTDAMLDLPLPMALLPDRCLIMPEGYSWHADEVGNQRGFALLDPEGRKVATVGPDHHEAWVSTTSYHRWFERVDLASSANLAEALARVECATCNSLHLVPHDRQEPGAAMDLLYRHCCLEASREIWEGASHFVTRASRPEDVPLEDLLAARYAALYAEGTSIPSALCEAYVDSRGTTSLTELIESCASMHAESDLDWVAEEFQERGSVSVGDVERLSFPFRANAPLSETVGERVTGATRGAREERMGEER